MGTSTAVGGTNNSSGGDDNGLEDWAIALIVIGSVLAIGIIVAVAIYAIKSPSGGASSASTKASEASTAATHTGTDVALEEAKSVPAAVPGVPVAKASGSGTDVALEE